eukprot:CAMPEP_0172325964 /NCGR_PEP_ID=MMETSP1058-20130122/55188_1 /TAXON_ID=83371 /ORGANISM="Detonula confervacea, Strain CCMP 353" /LENGTH=179 /DNA_ID=CAMNT_0013042635 /DNA_START=176 /DNA_END=715 /DNA_ORIENTATION=+
MTQNPSRLSAFEPAVPKDLQTRSLDMAFFGLITSRRRALVEASKAYIEAHPDRKVTVQHNNRVIVAANSYKEAKTCLLVHSFRVKSGGEYHRLSEFAPFGCIPVMEHFSDRVGMGVYEKCAGAVFANITNIVGAAADVVSKIDQGLYNSRGSAMIDWWKTGIHWERILPTVFGISMVPN